MKTSSRIFLAVVAATVVAVLGGCGSATESGTQAHAKKGNNHSTGPVDPAERSPQDMVSGVSRGKGGPPVGLKYELRSAPQAGQQVDIDIAVLPDAATITRIYGKFEGGGPGLEVIDGGELAAVDKPAQGKVIRHVLRVYPKQDGIFTLNAAIAVDLGDDSIIRNFTIPVIVGQGLPELTAKSDVADAPAATGVAPKTH